MPVGMFICRLYSVCNQVNNLYLYVPAFYPYLAAYILQ